MSTALLRVERPKTVTGALNNFLSFRPALIPFISADTLQACEAYLAAAIALRTARDNAATPPDDLDTLIAARVTALTAVEEKIGAAATAAAAKKDANFDYGATPAIVTRPLIGILETLSPTPSGRA